VPFVYRKINLGCQAHEKKKGTSMTVIEAAGAGDVISMARLSGPAIGHIVPIPEVVITDNSMLCYLLLKLNTFSFSIVSNFLVFTYECYL
jgi:hypothetical protein